MSDLFVYRSSTPEVVAAWEAACGAIDAYVKQTGDILREAGLGDYAVYRRNDSSLGKFAGLAVPEGEEPPAGWRMNRDYAVPNKRRKTGRDIEAALNAVRHPGLPSGHLPGMPSHFFSGMGLRYPGVRLLEDTTAVYVQWSADPEQATRGCTDTVDTAIWERVPLSRYYAEAERAERSAESATAS
jgi:hypothetical protein